MSSNVSTATAKSERRYCSREALHNGAQLCGTAVRVDTWLLIEYWRPWKPKALQDNELSPEINTHLNTLPERLKSATGEHLRIQFIKQAASADRLGPRVYIASHLGLFVKSCADWNELMQIDTRVCANPTQAGFVTADPIVLVCTNGQRDVCCARFGLPVYEALRQELGQRAWQTTHVGGHRYAANLVYLPGGWGFGFVDAEGAPALVEKMDRGQLDLTCLRGQSCLDPFEQAAEYYARLACHGLAVNDVRLLSSLRVEENVVAAEFETVDGIVDVHIERRMGPMGLASCSGESKPQAQFQLLQLRRR